MKRVVSVGSSTRNHKAVVRLLGKEISLERIGTDGNVQPARALYRELPIPIRSPQTLKRVARVLMPVVSLTPMELLTPTGEKKDRNQPRWHKQWAWASAVGGDLLYIRTTMPLDVSGKVISTNLSQTHHRATQLGRNHAT